MRMAQADDTGEAEPCQVERRMSTIDHDVKVRHGQSNAAADTHDQPVAEWREVGYEHRWAWLVLPIALWQGHAHHITGLHLPYSGLGSSRVMPLISGSFAP